jgi:hypothetical protein
MKLTLERDNGTKCAIVLEGGEDKLENRLEAMQGICKLLDSWATERDKDATEAK